MTRSFDAIGTTGPKRDGAGKLTGRTRDPHDLVLPRLAHGKILRSRHPHARLVRVDTRRARALPGVLAVLTGDDVEPRPFGFAKDQTALKRGKVRSVRDEVAAVAAETPEIAEAALALIDVEYAELPAVFDPHAALAPGAPLVHEELGGERAPPPLPVNLRRREPRVRPAAGGREGHLPAPLRDAAVPGQSGANPR